MTTESTPALSSDVRSVLSRCDMFAEPADIVDQCNVRDEMGRWLFKISTSINAHDLMQLLMHATRMHNEGIAIGKAGMQASFRALINAAEQPQETPL